MESKNAASLVKMGVVEQLIDERLRKAKDGADEDDDDGDHNRLLSKLENLKEEKNDDDFKKKSDDDDDQLGNEEGTESDEIIIARELRKVKKQNFITHCLLSAMIVLTLTWQLSEVTMIFKLKDGITHPFRSISHFFGFNKTTQVPLLNELPGLDLKNEQDDDDDDDH